MKQKFTAIMLAIIATFSLFGLVGCKKDNKSLVYFLNFKPESASVYEELAKFYEDETGIKVVLQVLLLSQKYLIPVVKEFG